MLYAPNLVRGTRRRGNWIREASFILGTVVESTRSHGDDRRIPTFIGETTPS
jgi:hypothetical protein